MEMIERFRKQLSLINIQFEAAPDLVKKAVWSCYQESPVEFRDHSLYDPGAYPEPPLSGKRCVSRTASQRQDNMAYHPALDRSLG